MRLYVPRVRVAPVFPPRRMAPYYAAGCELKQGNNRLIGTNRKNILVAMLHSKGNANRTVSIKFLLEVESVSIYIVKL